MMTLCFKNLCHVACTQPVALRGNMRLFPRKCHCFVFLVCVCGLQCMTRAYIKVSYLYDFIFKLNCFCSVCPVFKIRPLFEKNLLQIFVNFLLSIIAGATNQIQLSHHIIDFLKDKNSNIRDKCIFAQNKANYIRDTTF